MKNRFNFANVWAPAFDNQDGENPSTTEPSESTEPTTEPKTSPGETEKSFTQSELNAIIKKEKEKAREHSQNVLNELQMLRKKATLTAEEKKELDKRVEDLQNQVLTKEQKAKNEHEKLQKQFETEVKDLTSDRDKWKDLYTQSTIERSLLDAGHEHDAVDPEQLVKLMRHDTQLAEELTDDGEPTGRLVPKVTFQDTDKDGNVIELKLHPRDAVKRMSEMDRYFNLFKNKGTGGVGDMARKSKGEPSIADLAKENPQEYIEKRQKGELSL